MFLYAFKHKHIEMKDYITLINILYQLVYKKEDIIYIIKI